MISRGVWAAKFATAYPASSVFGVDLGPILAGSEPINCHFSRANVEDERWKPHYLVDFFHFRMMGTRFDHPLRLIDKAYDNLSSGGWIELQDMEMEALSSDGSTEGTFMETFGNCIEVGLAKMKRDHKIARQYERMLREAGFVDIVARQIPMPCGPWSQDPKLQELGRLFLSVYTEEAVDGLTRKILLASGLTAERCTQLVAHTVQDYHDPDIHGYFIFHVICGRRP